MTTETTTSATTYELEVDGIGTVPVRVDDVGQGRPVLLLHGGAGPQSVSAFAALLAPRAEGIDVDAVIASRRLLKDVEPVAFDINLALYVGYFLTQCNLPAPSTSPHLRDHQRWQGEVCWDWLAERRGWS